LQSVQFHFIWRRRRIVDFSVFSLGCLRQFLAESLHAAADWVFFSFARLSLGSLSPLFLSAFSVGSFSRLFSLASSLQRHFLLVTFDENASNGSIWIRLARSFPTRVSSLLSAGFFFPSRRFTFEEMSRMGSLSMRLVEAVPTLVSFCNLGLY
jgi:hypothetical protein